MLSGKADTQTMANKLIGGYDVEFTEDLPADHICSICFLALRDPIQLEECGHRFCESCFNTYKINRFVAFLFSNAVV